MGAAVVFPDIEAAAVDYLRAALDARSEPYTEDVHVSNQRGATGRQVVVRRDGGPRLHLFEQPRLAVNVWAANDADAADLALMVAALVMAWPDGSPVLSARQLSGPSAIPEDDESRRFMLFELRVRGTQLVPA